MGVRRAHKFVGVPSLLLVGGCVALTGVGELEVDPDADGGGVTEAGAGGAFGHPDGFVNSGDMQVSSPPPGDDDDSALPDAEAPDSPTGEPDTGTPDKDTGAPDTGAPDTGAPDSGSNVGVRCGSSNTCSGNSAICCYLIIEEQSCVASTRDCEDEIGFACDGDEDCATGKVCCVQWSKDEEVGASSCQTSCSASAGGGTIFDFTGAGLACANDPSRCANSGPDGAAQTCKAAPEAPSTILACQ